MESNGTKTKETEAQKAKAVESTENSGKTEALAQHKRFLSHHEAAAQKEGDKIRDLLSKGRDASEDNLTEPHLPSTGVKELDARIDWMHTGTLTAAFVMMDISQKDKVLGDKIRKRLLAHVEPYADMHRVDTEFDHECNVATEISWWFAFWVGMNINKES